MSSFEKTNSPEFKKSRLGRGLGSLLGDLETIHSPVEKSDSYTAKSFPTQVKIDLLYANPHQPRREFEPQQLRELADSIKIHGIIQPILVMPDGHGKYQIVAGERRWRAGQLAGLKEVPVVFQGFDERKSMELAIIENIQRQDLNPVEEAKAYQNLMKKYHLTQMEVADRVGKDRATVANLLRILSLETEILDFLTSGQISLGHAKVLLAIDNKIIQRKLARRIIKENLSVRQLERLIANHKNPQPNLPESQGIENRHIQNISDRLQKSLGTKVSIDYSLGKGQISIKFYSDEQFDDLVEKIGRL